MPTLCSQEFLKFHPLEKCEVRGGFDGGAITSDAGGLLHEVERRTGIIGQFAGCFRDHRQPERIEHRVENLVAQRVYGLALGYEDLNDREELRRDPLHGNREGRFFIGYHSIKYYTYLYIYLSCNTYRAGGYAGRMATGGGKRRVCGPPGEADSAGVARSADDRTHDSAFCREELMAWCEANQVEYVLGLAKNDRLPMEIAAELAQAHRRGSGEG